MVSTDNIDRSCTTSFSYDLPSLLWCCASFVLSCLLVRAVLTMSMTLVLHPRASCSGKSMMHVRVDDFSNMRWEASHSRTHCFEASRASIFFAKTAASRFRCYIHSCKPQSQNLIACKQWNRIMEKFNI